MIKLSNSSSLSKKFTQLLFSALLSILGIFNVQATALNVGDIAPNFKLQATNGKFYQLSDYKGKQAVVLAWYPKANTYGCTMECKSLTEDGHLIREFNASYMMVSVDKLLDNKKFAEDQKADFPMLSDPTKQTAKAYDVLHWLGVARRVTFVIVKMEKSSVLMKMFNQIPPPKISLIH